MKTIILKLFVFLVLVPQALHSQRATTSPSFPVENRPLQITFDLHNSDLANYSSDDLYVHTGLITDRSSSGSDWRYSTSWLQNDAKYKLTPLGNDRWSLSILPDVRSFYDLPPNDETIAKIAFVIRNSDGSKEVKDNGKDIFVPVYDSQLRVRLEMPSKVLLIDKDEVLHIKATASKLANISLSVGNAVVGSSINSELIDQTHKFQDQGNTWLIAEAGDGLSVVRDSVLIVVKKAVPRQPLPAGMRAGINYPSDTSAIFVLHAPGKRNVFLLGDFNDWTIDNDYMLNNDGENWWIAIDNLEKGKEYAFQYLVDDSLRIADPYTNKILDPYNDRHIPQSVYPDLKPYPSGKTEGIVSVAQTARKPFDWQTKDFVPVPKDRLVIYELLIRDFTPEHSFESTMAKLDYLQNLGINAIELLPVNEFEGNSSWGYNPSFYFAVDKYYGTADAFKKFVDECHKRGIAVIIDMVLNHSYGQSPLVQLYFDHQTNRPSPDNPWYNAESPNQFFSWGYDFNHQSDPTKQLVDSVNSYWMSEFKIDGFRFDFTKGFTNNPGDGWAYDASRIEILTRMANEIYKRKPDAIVIFEHLADNSEETALADADIMLWGNMNHAYAEATMGYTENNKTDMTWGLYTERGWQKPNLVSYMESHDEERIMYKAETWGKIPDVGGALKRAELSAAFYLMQPGAKMIWQFGELGYDYSINTCSDGTTITQNCRVSEKPIRWDYFDDPRRKELYKAYANLLEVKNKYDAFRSGNVSYSLKGGQKYMIWRGEEYNAVLVGNFDVTDATLNITLPRSGEWVDTRTGQSLQMPSANYAVTLKGGEYKLLVDKGSTTSVVDEKKPDQAIRITRDYVDYLDGVALEITVYSVSGTVLKKQNNTDSVSVSDLPPGVYVVKVETAENIHRQKFVR